MYSFLRSHQCGSIRRALFVPFLFLAVTPTACRKGSNERTSAGDGGPSNFLLITLDTTRADRIGCYGHEQAQTPTIDDLARRGARFTRAMSPVPMTLPAHASILTGLYPREHGVRVNGYNAVPESLVTLQRLFRARGKRTAAFLAAYVLNSAFGLNRDFDVYDDDIDRSGDDRFNLAAERPANEVTDRAIAWLSARPDAPFFCWIHYYDAHDPYEPPAPYNYLVGDPYDGELAFVDAQLKRVIDWLDQENLRDRTSILIVGDHGEAFGEHQEHGHVMFLYEENIHVPLIVVHPGITRAGAMVETPVGLIDLAPTVAELFGLTGIGGSGRSLVGALKGQPMDPRPLYAETHYGSYSYGWAQQRSIITDRWKYVSSTVPELFDLQVDPKETTNRLESEPELAGRLSEALRQMYGSMTPSSAGAASLSDESRKKLESLGYASGGSDEGTDDFLTDGAADPKASYDVVRTMNKARALADARKWEEALPLFQQAAEGAPGSYYVGEQLAKCYEELDRPEGAIETWRTVLEHNPRHTIALARSAELLLQNRKPDEAVKSLEVALDLDEQNARTHEILARAYRQTGRLEDAVRHARRAVELAPADGHASITLGTILSESGRADEAVAVLRDAAKQGGVRSEVLLSLATIEIKQGDVDQAIANLEAILRDTPAHSRAIGSITKLFREQGRSADMVQILRRAVEAEPENLAFTYSLAQLLATSSNDLVRNGTEAVRLTERALILTRGEHPGVIALHAAALAETGAFEAAIDEADRALQIARREKAEKLALQIESQLEGYRSQKAYREPGL